MKLPEERPDAILCADLHLREDQPLCRTDNFWETQKEKLIQLQNIQNNYDPIPPVPVLCAGDIFHRWKASPRLLSMALEYLPDNMITIPGNHDLPAHNLNKLEWSALTTLEKAEKTFLTIKTITFPFYKKDGVFKVFSFPYGTSLKHASKGRYSKIALIHKFAYKGRKPFPGATGGVVSIMKKLKGYDLIVCGDNHQPFTHEENETLFVNPGSISRQTSDQMKHRPRVYLWYSNSRSVLPVYLDIDQSVVTQSHNKTVKEYNNRINLFISKLDSKVNVELDFVPSLKEYMNSNEISQPVYDKVMEAVDGN